MTAGIKIDEAGLITDLDAARRNRDLIAQMRQAEQMKDESKYDGRQENRFTQKRNNYQEIRTPAPAIMGRNRKS